MNKPAQYVDPATIDMNNYRVFYQTQINDYYVDRNGDILSMSRGNKKIKRLRKNSVMGYDVVALNRKTCTLFYVHRAVAIAWLPNPNNYAEVDHIDFNRRNNNVENLRWFSKSENLKSAWNAGRYDARVKQNRGENHHVSKLSDNKVRKIRNSKLTCKELAAKYGVSLSTISNIRTRRVWKHVTDSTTNLQNV